MKRTIHWGSRILITLVILWGVLALAIRLSTPLLEHAHDPIAGWLSEKLGQPVRFKRIQASWWGIGPRLKLQQVSVGPADEAITLQSISVDLSHVSLLQGQLLDALRLTLDGLQLNLVRESDRRIHVVGIPSGSKERGTLPLPRHLRLRHTRIRWEDRFLETSPIEVNELDLDLVRHDQELTLRGRLNSTLGQVRVNARIKGFLGREDWHGNSYLKVQGLQLRQLLSGYLPARYRLEGGELDAELWQQWEQATEVSARGHFNVSQAELVRQDDTPRRFHAQRLSGSIDYQRRSAGEWRIVADELILQSASGATPEPGTLVIHRSAQAEAPHFEVAAIDLPLDTLRDLALVLPTDRQLAGALEGLQPSGLVHGLRLSLSGEHSSQWALDGKLQGLSLDRWQSIPGISGLDIRFAATPQRATMQLEGRNMQLDYRQLFREPHSLPQLNGTLHWQRGDNTWHLFSDDLDFSTPDLAGKAWFELEKADGQPLYLNLHGRISDGDVSSTGRYLPTAIMGEQVVGWLDRSLSQGHLDQADVLVSGPLPDFPFHKRRSGVFEVVAMTRNTPLAYQDGWPPLQDVSAKLFFHENSLDIDLGKGRILESDISTAHARIASLHPTSPLQVKGRVAGTLSDEIRLLQEPALRDRFGHIAEALSTTGKAELELAFQVPLAEGHGKYRLDGTLHLDNDRMSLKDWDLTIDRIRGDLGISLDSLNAKGISGVAFGSPVTVDVHPTQQATRISAQANWPVAVLQQRFPKLPLQLASGAADFSVNLDIPGLKAPKGTRATIEVSSDLKGVGLELPSPLGKTPAEMRALRVLMPIDKPNGTLHIRYAQKLDARFSADGERGELRYVRGSSQLPGKPGYRILASLPSVDIDEWQALGAHLGSGNSNLPWQVELETPSLSLGDMELANAQLKAHGQNGAIDANIESPRVAGNIHYRKGEQDVLSANLSRLYLELETGDAASETLPDPRAGPDPRSLPLVDLQCADLRINKAELGKARLALKATESGRRISGLSVQGPSGTLKASGTWLWRDQAAVTRLSGHLHSPDLGALLAGLGYPRSMHDAETDLRFVFDWSGNPMQINRATLHGKADLQISDGRLSEVDPGIARVLGLLSLDALKRRLKFDFGDLLKKGYTFDSIQGHFELGNGQAKTSDLVIDGPSGRIEIGGRIGLVARDFDQVVQVAPKLDATLVIASTIAGGPVAGAATFLAQRLLSEEVDKINRFEYSVTGSWDEPRLTPLKSGGPVSAILNTLSGKKSEVKTQAQEKAIDETKTRPRKGLLEKLLGKPKKPAGNGSPSPEAELPGAE